MAGFRRLFVFVHDFNHRIDWHIFNEPEKRDQRCCSEHGRVSQISCHSLVRDLTTHIYLVVCLLCHAFEEARGVCTRRQRDSGVGGTRPPFGSQFLRATSLWRGPSLWSRWREMPLNSKNVSMDSVTGVATGRRPQEMMLASRNPWAQGNHAPPTR